jgi:hypothetical protein
VNSLAVPATVAAVVVLLVVTELLTAVLPLIIVLVMVPPEERHGVAELLAAADSSRRLRFWRALRVAVLARRLDRARNERHNPYGWDRRDVDDQPRSTDQAGSQR